MIITNDKATGFNRNVARKIVGGEEKNGIVLYLEVGSAVLGSVLPPLRTNNQDKAISRIHKKWSQVLLTSWYQKDKLIKHFMRECWNRQTSTFQRRVYFVRVGSTPISRTI